MKILKNIYETLKDILDYLNNIQDLLDMIEFNTDSIFECIKNPEDREIEGKLKKIFGEETSIKYIGHKSWKN